MTTIAQMRTTIVERAHWGISNQASIEYEQRRPMQSKEKWRDKVLPLVSDCSEAATGIYFAAGAPDPNGLDYNGYGNTNTMMDQGDVISYNDALPGDLLIYRQRSGETVHVCVLIEKSAGDPLLFSHGADAGPIAIRMSAESAYHARVAQPAYPVWVRALPTSEKPRWHWEVRDGAGRLIGTATSPRMYVAQHLRLFWRPRMQVKFIRKYDR